MTVEHNPARYSELSKPRTPQETEESISAFFEEVKAARERHKIADVHVILRVLIEREGQGDAPAFAVAHFGAVQESEGMCAWAFARASEERRAFLDHCKVEGTRTARGA